MISPSPLPVLDRQLCLVANRWGARRAVGRIFGAISRLGDGVVWYALMLLFATCGGTSGALAAAHMLATGIVAVAMYRYLKRWTRRPRPFRHCDGVVAHVPPLDEFSFPSGHTLHAVSFSVVALAYFPLLAPLLFVLCALIAASRVVLGLHYPSDVLAAIVIGAGLGQFSLWLATLLS